MLVAEVDRVPARPRMHDVDVVQRLAIALRKALRLRQHQLIACRDKANFLTAFAQKCFLEAFTRFDPATNRIPVIGPCALPGCPQAEQNLVFRADEQGADRLEHPPLHLAYSARSQRNNAASSPLSRAVATRRPTAAPNL